jgi:tetratricopeptide (TPR) repeat protein
MALSFAQSAQFKASFVGFSLAMLTSIAAIAQLVSLPPAADALSVQTVEDVSAESLPETESLHSQQRPRSKFNTAQTPQERYNEGWGYQQAGDWLQQKGQTQAAREQYGKALEIMQELKQEKHVSVIVTAIGQTYQKSKDYSRAISQYEEALDLSHDRNETGRITANLAYAHRLNGNPQKAIQLYEQALTQTQGDRTTQSMIHKHLAIAKQEMKRSAKPIAKSTAKASAKEIVI